MWLLRLCVQDFLWLLLLTSLDGYKEDKAKSLTKWLKRQWQRELTCWCRRRLSRTTCGKVLKRNWKHSSKTREDSATNTCNRLVTHTGDNYCTGIGGEAEVAASATGMESKRQTSTRVLCVCRVQNLVRLGSHLISQTAWLCKQTHADT